MNAPRPFIARDPQACTGCRLCELACHLRDSGLGATAGCLREPVAPRMRASREAGGLKLSFCTHCEDAPCALACREAAIVLEPEGVRVDPDGCAGCPDCLAACPLGAIRLVPEAALRPGAPARSLAWKCDLCARRPDGPACVQACPAKALVRVDPRSDRTRRNATAARALRRLTP